MTKSAYLSFSTLTCYNKRFFTPVFLALSYFQKPSASFTTCPLGLANFPLVNFSYILPLKEFTTCFKPTVYFFAQKVFEQTESATMGYVHTASEPTENDKLFLSVKTMVVYYDSILSGDEIV